MLRILLAAGAAFIAGCRGGGEKSSDFIPDVPVECTTGQAADCAQTSLPLFVGLIDSLAGAECDDFLTGMTSTMRQTSFLAFGTATTARTGIFLTATVRDWRDSTGGPIDVLPPGTYVVCAFIDTNANDRIDVNEPVGRGALTAGQTGFILNDWSPAFN